MEETEKSRRNISSNGASQTAAAGRRAQCVFLVICSANTKTMMLTELGPTIYNNARPKKIKNTAFLQ